MGAAHLLFLHCVCATVPSKQQEPVAEVAACCEGLGRLVMTFQCGKGNCGSQYTMARARNTSHLLRSSLRAQPT